MESKRLLLYHQVFKTIDKDLYTTDILFHGIVMMHMESAKCCMAISYLLMELVRCSWNRQDANGNCFTKSLIFL